MMAAKIHQPAIEVTKVHAPPAWERRNDMLVHVLSCVWKVVTKEGEKEGGTEARNIARESLL